MIKKYKNFLKESKLEEYELDEALLEVTYGNYSSMCKSKESPDDGFNEILKELEDYNWSFDRIRKEFNNDDIVSLYNRMSDKNGQVDLFFYKIFEKFGLDKDMVELGGAGWSDIHVTDDEAFIRYSYGYHNTEYGMLAINQLEGGLEEFLKHAIKYLKQWIYEEIPLHILNIYVENDVNFDKVTGFQKSWDSTRILNIKDFSVVEEDRMIIYVNDIANFLNNLPVKYSESSKKKLSEYFQINSKHIYDKISSILSQFSLDIDFTGTDAIIWIDLEEDY
jgi:hypothetical protein